MIITFTPFRLASFDVPFGGIQKKRYRPNLRRVVNIGEDVSSILRSRKSLHKETFSSRSRSQINGNAERETESISGTVLPRDTIIPRWEGEREAAIVFARGLLIPTYERDRLARTRTTPRNGFSPDWRRRRAASRAGVTPLTEDDKNLIICETIAGEL